MRDEIDLLDFHRRRESPGDLPSSSNSSSPSSKPPGKSLVPWHTNTTSATNESTVQIFERYRDSYAIVTHVTHTFAPFDERFMALVDGAGFFVYGSPDAEARKIVDGFDAVYMVPFAGFIR